MTKTINLGPTKRRFVKPHLKTVHGIYVEDVKTDAGLKAAHDADHERRFGNWLFDHTHEAAT